MPIVKLTQHVIDHELICPEGKTRVELCDVDLPGLYVLVSAANQGRGTFFLRYKDRNGKTCHQKIARTTDIDLVEARKRAKHLKGEINVLGRDPRAEQKAQKEVPTLDAFFKGSYLPFIKPRKRSWKRDEELFRLRIADKFGRHRLNQISRHQVQTFHAELLQSGLAPASCDHHLKLMRRMFNLAAEWNVFNGPNPLARIGLFNPDNRVQHRLDDEQLARLLHVLHSDSNRPVCRIALFLLSTGARVNEALRAHWDQVDVANRLWVIPATNTKSRRTRGVPLNDAALEVLSQLDNKGGFVFVNKETGKPYTSIAKVWTRLRNAAGLRHVRLHDLRHNFASFLANDGQTLLTIKEILGHQDPKTTLRYTHFAARTLRDASASASAAITRATKKAA